MVIKMGEMDINIEERVQKAVDLFKSGYNCSQSVFRRYFGCYIVSSIGWRYGTSERGLRCCFGIFYDNRS